MIHPLDNHDFERVPPQDLEAEQATLGAMLLGQVSAVSVVAELLEPGDFYRDAHGHICRACFTLFRRNDPIDLITVSGVLRDHDQLEAVGGLDYLDRLVRTTPYSDNVATYAKRVKDNSLLRRLLFASQGIAANCYQPEGGADVVLDAAEQQIMAVAEARGGESFVSLSTAIERAYEDLEERAADKIPTRGLQTGYHELDRLLSGLNPGDLIILAARPSMGKTSLAMCIALNVATNPENPGGVGIFSMEMTREQIVADLMCTHAEINLSRWRNAQMRNEDWERISRSYAELRRAKVFIDDTSALSPLELRARARRMGAELGGLKLLVVDYLQLMRGDQRTENRVNEISALTRALKGVAKDLGVPVIVLSQLSRAVESRENKRPLLSDLRESGQIEADADVVLFIYRENYYKKEGLEEPSHTVGHSYDDSPTAVPAEVIISKHRNGPTGTAVLGFIGHQKRFTNVEPQFMNRAPEPAY